MRQVQWIIFGVFMIGMAVYQQREELAADDWAGLPFF